VAIHQVKGAGETPALRKSTAPSWGWPLQSQILQRAGFRFRAEKRRAGCVDL